MFFIVEITLEILLICHLIRTDLCIYPLILVFHPRSEMYIGTMNQTTNMYSDISGADLGKILTDLLQNERSKRKLLGGSGEIFSILTT